MSAKSIAEALAAGVANTPDVSRWHERFYVTLGDGESLWTNELIQNQNATDGSVARVELIRADVAEAALEHLAERLERAEARLEAVSREGWRASVLLAAEKEQLESERAYAEADRAAADGADESAIEELHEQAGAFEDEARRLRACVSADDKQEAKP